MSKTHQNITPEISKWIAQQRIFFVASAPLAADGHINVSPKGGDALRISGPLDVVYQDFTGSGAETVAHVRENGRIVIMFCAFDGPPKIVRLHGHGTVSTPGDPRYAELLELFPFNPGTRAFVHVQIDRVSDSCGYSVPLFEFQAQRWGSPIEEIRPGDVVWIPPGEKHWHGAAPTTAMTHIAIQEQLDGKAVD